MGNISSYNCKKEKINTQNANPSTWGLGLEEIQKGGSIINFKIVGERNAVGNETAFHKNDILYSKLRPYLLKIWIAPFDGICTPEIVPFCVYGSTVSGYIVTVLKTPYIDF